MKLGEQIYKLRTEKSLSQGDLADALDVSRQSVSKWENDTAVPDLDKLIKLCDIFEISLDELAGREKNEKSATYDVPQSSATHQPKIAGYIFLGITLFSAVFFLVTAPMALYLCIPLTLCTIICFKVKKHAGYWCAWAIYLPIYLYLLFGIALYVMQIIEVIFLIVMTFVTYKYVTDIKFNLRKETRLFLLSVYILFVIGIILGTWLFHYSGIITGFISKIFFNEWIYVAVNFVKTIILGIGMIHTVCLVREIKENK